MYSIKRYKVFIKIVMNLYITKKSAVMHDIKEEILNGYSNCLRLWLYKGKYV